MPESSRGPLAGIRVLDFTHFVAGPWATQMMADLGADIIKIEPTHGEIGRSVGRTFDGDESSIFLGLNRNKRCLAIDLKSRVGREVVARLARTVDCVTHNFRPGAAERLGLDHATLCQENSRLISCSLSAFGESGPYVDRPANDPIIQGISGAMRTGAGSGPPVRMGVCVPDFAAALAMTLAITAALVERDRTGVGQELRTNLLDNELFAQVDQVTSMSASANGFDRLGALVSRSFVCADGRALVVAPDDAGSWAALTAILGHPAEAGDTAESVERVTAALESVLSNDGAEHWQRRLVRAGIPVAEVRSLSTVMNHEADLVASGRPCRLSVSRAGKRSLLSMRTPGAPVDSTPAHPPRLGQHSDLILQELGFTAGERGAVFAAGDAVTA